jgi:hypothetical protein
MLTFFLGDFLIFKSNAKVHLGPDFHIVTNFELGQNTNRNKRETNFLKNMSFVLRLLVTLIASIIISINVSAAANHKSESAGQSA